MNIDAFSIIIHSGVTAIPRKPKINVPWALKNMELSLYEAMFSTCSFHGNSMNNLLSYCGLVDARISASEKDLPVKSVAA